jgi:Glycosyl transferase family 2
MYCNPHLVVNRPPGKPKISVILIDWGVRESFHGVEYLNRQTAARTDYELIWLEFYDREPEGLHRLVAASAGGAAVLDRWIVLGYPDDLIFHKHRLYNVGLLAAAGDVCVICDSDAIFRSTFIERLIREFEETPDGVIHVDEVRNTDRRFYPFNYPTIEDILGPGCLNWRGTTTAGVVDRVDRIHGANYGACLAARRQNMLAVGGADEHLDYLGYVCGPYDLTFRLVNHFGRPERWLPDEYLYHVWHPNASGGNTDYQGPHDTKFMALRALDARASLRIEPWLRNPWIDGDGGGKTLPLDQLLPLMAEREEPEWKQGAQPAGPPDTVYWVERSFAGHSIFYHAGSLYALPEKHMTFDPERAAHGGYADLLAASDLDALQAMILARAFGAASGGGFGGLLRRIRAQPLHRLPARLLRKGRKLVASWQRTQADAGVSQQDQRRTAKIGDPS